MSIAVVDELAAAPPFALKGSVATHVMIKVARYGRPAERWRRAARHTEGLPCACPECPRSAR